MDHDFWKRRWEKNDIGFHMDESHLYLRRFFHRLHVGPEIVFVPLCGKSPDLLWLREQGARVLGIELSHKAISDFYLENGLQVAIDDVNGFERFHHEGLTILCGDLFQLSARYLEEVRAVYDRGSLVALPPPMRRQYADFLCRTLPVDCRILLISYDYDQRECAGPPFSVPSAEIEELYGRDFSLELLAEQDALPTHRKLQQRGVKRLKEFASLLTRR